MSYTQHFGLSRKSPLNDHTKYHCGPDYKNDAGECVGWDYEQKRKEEEKKGVANNIIDKQNKYTKEQLADYDYDKGYNIAGKNIFGLTREEMEKERKISDVKRRKEEVSTGKVGPEIKEGFDTDGNPSLTKRKDGTYVYGDQVVDAPKDGQKFKMGADEVQTTLDFASVVDPTGFLADGANALISGVRGAGALAQGDYESAKKFGKAGAASTFFMIPGTDIGKIGKFNKMMSKAGKTRYISKTGKYAQPILETEGKLTNLFRGVGNFSLRKGKNTKLNKKVSSNISKFFGGGKASQFVGKKAAANVTSAKGIKNYSKLEDNEKQS